MSARIIVLVIFDVVRRFSVAESVAEYLIKYGAFRPIGNFETGSERKIVFRLHVFDTAQTIISNRVVIVV